MRKPLLLFVSFFFSALALLAQQTVTGKVTDANGLPLAGISVQTTKTGRGTATAADGTFRLTVSADD